MELSHRDQTESSAAGGFLPANTHHPLTFHYHTTLYLFTTLEEEMSSLCSGITFAGLEGDSEHQNNNSISPRLSFALFTHNCILLCVVMREGQSVACALVSLAPLCSNVMFTQPYQCHAPKSHHSALTPGCCLALSHQTAFFFFF